MDFELNEEQKMVREMVRDFAQKELAPIAAQIDEEGRFPMGVFKRMGELGLLGLPWSQEYGGGGADYVSYALAVEEISYASGSLGLSYEAHISLASAPIFLFGSEEQKRTYLVPLAKGEYLGAFGLTEAAAGSDAGATETSAVLDGKHWVINGSKRFITSGSIADVVIITAITEPGKGSHGISNLIVEKGTRGFTYGRDENKMGLKASITSELIFEDCRIPKENLLGTPGEGFRQFLRILDGGRVSIAAMALGLGRAAADASVEYAKQRVQFGQPIAEFQAIRWMIADMATQLEAARLLVYNAAYRQEQGLPFTKEAAMAKLFASEAAERACRNAIQIHGGYGYCKDYPVERYYRDCRLTTIGEGTSEIQRLVIARQVLGAAKSI